MRPSPPNLQCLRPYSLLSKYQPRTMRIQGIYLETFGPNWCNLDMSFAEMGSLWFWLCSPVSFSPPDLTQRHGTLQNRVVLSNLGWRFPLSGGHRGRQGYAVHCLWLKTRLGLQRFWQTSFVIRITVRIVKFVVLDDSGVLTVHSILKEQ